MAIQYIFDSAKVRSKLDASLVENTIALTTSIRQFFDNNGTPNNHALTVWGHRSAILPNMGISISVSDEGAVGVSEDARMIVTLYIDDGAFYEAYSNDQGEASNGPSCPPRTKEMFLQLVGEMSELYNDISAFPTGTTRLIKTA